MLLAGLAFIAAVSFLSGRARASLERRCNRPLINHPLYHGLNSCAWVSLPVLAALIVYYIVTDMVIEGYVLDLVPPDIQDLDGAAFSLIRSRIDDLVAGGDLGVRGAEWMSGIAAQLARVQTWQDYGGLILMVMMSGTLLIWRYQRFDPMGTPQYATERLARAIFFFCASLAVLTTFGIVLSMLFEVIKFFQVVKVADFFFTTVWNPRFAEAGDPTDGGDLSLGQFGLLPLLWGTLYISLVAMLVAGPIGLMAAVFLSHYAHPTFRSWAKPILEILAGIPTVVYGFFALIFVGPILHDWGQMMGVDIGATSVLVAGSVMGVMIIPYVSSLSEDIMSSVPRSLVESSLAMGATPSETIKKIVIPAALPGIIGAFILAFSRAIGETMIVVMAAGIAARLTWNPLESMTTITVKIVSQLTGDLEFDSPSTQVAFALGLSLFIVTFVMNMYALRVVRKYHLRYD